jgi:hypothetical protein
VHVDIFAKIIKFRLPAEAQKIKIIFSDFELEALKYLVIQQ